MHTRSLLALGLLSCLLLSGTALAHIGGFRGGIGFRGGYGGFGGFRGGYAGFNTFRGGYSVPHYSIPSYSMPHYSYTYSAPRLNSFTTPRYQSYTSIQPAGGYTRSSYLGYHPANSGWAPPIRSTALTRPSVGWTPPVASRGWEPPRIGTVNQINRTAIGARLDNQNVFGTRIGTTTRTALNRPRPGITDRNLLMPTRNVNVNASRMTNLAYSSRNIVNPARFYNRPWSHWYPWYHGGWHGWRYWPRFWGGWGWGYGLGFTDGLLWGDDLDVGVPTIVYNNPYYVPVPVPVDSGPTIIQSSTLEVPQPLDYSRPIQVTSTRDVSTTDDDIPRETKQRMDSARAAFARGDYSTALRECDQALQLLPGDTNLHEFRALCLFAQQKYQEAAGVLYAVLAAGPGWDWNTLSSFYTRADDYTKQLRALEAFVREHPQDASAHFVLAYHYLVLDQRQAALEQLRVVIKLQPKDKISAGLAEALQKDESTSSK